MIFNLDNIYEVPKFKEYVNKLLESKGIVEIKKKHPNRTIAQNRYFYLLLNWFALETGYGVEEVKIDFFKRTCNKELFEVEVTNKRGQKVKVLRSSAELDTKEMTVAIERFRNWASAVPNIYLPAPNEHQFLQHIEKEMEQNEVYR